MKPIAAHRIAQNCNESELVAHVRGRCYAVDVDHILMALFPSSKVSGRSLKTGKLTEFRMDSIKFMHPASEATVPGLRDLLAGIF